jgi:hypothetical protein
LLTNKATFVGNTASYLLKGHQKSAVRNSNPEILSEAEASNNSTSTPNLAIEGTPDEENRSQLLLPTRNDSQGSFTSEFGLEPYIERTISPKEIVKVEIGYNRPTYGDHVALKWEYSCKSEHVPSFAIHYIPDSLEITELTRLLPYGQSGSRVLFPLISVNAYSQPAYGSIPISHLKSGRIVFIWDNSSSFSKRFFKSIAYKILIANSEMPQQVHCNIGISRKSMFSLPIIFHPKPANDLAVLSVEFSTQSFQVPFSLHYDPLSSTEQPQTSSQDSTDVASRLNGLMSTSPLLPRKTLIPFNRSPNRGSVPPVSQTIPIKGKYGVYTLIWDNSASIVSTRHVDFHVKIN